MFVVVGLICGSLIGFVMSLFRKRSSGALLVASNALVFTVAIIWTIFILMAFFNGKSPDSTMGYMIIALWSLMAIGGILAISFVVGSLLSLINKEEPLRNGRMAIVDLCCLATIYIIGINAMVKGSSQTFLTDQRQIAEANQKADRIMSELPFMFRSMPPEAIIEQASDQVAQSAPGTLKIPTKVVETAKEAIRLRNQSQETYSPENVSRKRYLDVAIILSPAIGWISTFFLVPMHWKRRTFIP